MMKAKAGLFAALFVALTGCAADEDGMPMFHFSSKSYAPEDLTMRWDGQRGSESWTAATLAALEDHGSALTATMPADIQTWCPGYESAGEDGRKAFWTGLLSTLSKHESTWNPRAVGGGGLWYGLVQIAPATARMYGCEARSGEALKDGEANLSCAVRIMNVTVPRDNVVSQNMRGVAADWGPFHQSYKRNDMINWMREQPYCAG
ncbi:MAG: transglycosylase SLT domain-containing protein [Maritimibacter sp.]|jgi:hypothetical protein